MTDPTTDELDEALAKVLGVKRHEVLGWKLNIPGTKGNEPYADHISQDCNALMTAVAKLEEERGIDLERLMFHGERSCVWQFHGLDRFPFTRGDPISEALALANCIYAAVKDD